MLKLDPVNGLVLWLAVIGSCLCGPGVISAQTYDPQSGKSPAVLLDVPKDGLGYFETLERARALHKAQKWAEAEPLLEKLTHDYPRDPETWTMLWRVKARQKKWTESRPAAEKAGALIGWDLEFPNGYRVAIGFLEEGNKRAALDTLRRMIFEEHGFHRDDLFEWEEFASLKNDPEFLEIIGHPDPTGWSRDQGWTADIEFLHEEVKRVNPDYRDKPLPEELEQRYRALKNDVPKLSNEQIFFGLKRMLAPLHQGHVDFYPLPNSRFLPLRFYAFPEGIFIVDAAEEHKDLVGSRVVAIGDLPIEEAWRRLSEARSTDGDMQYVWDVASLSEVANLQGMGAVKERDSISLSLEKQGRPAARVSIPTVSTPPPDDPTKRIDRLLAPPRVQPPLFLSKMDEKFLEAPRPEKQALYVRINNLSDTKQETLEAFGRRLWTVLTKTNAKNLILDLRHNNGGVTQFYPELLRTLVAFTRTPGNQLYTVIGRRTYSATANFITDLERLADPIFVGEASSECCNIHGDPMTVTLPYSKLQVEATAVKWQFSSPSDRRREMSPEVPVQLTANAYFSGQDPIMDAIFRLIESRKAKN
jgi:hypothetical protein